MTDTKKEFSLFSALIPVLFLICALSFTIIVFGQDPHIPLILSAGAAAIVAVAHKVRWKEIREGIVHGITMAMGSILILMIVGTMIGTWIIGGIVPAMV